MWVKNSDGKKRRNYDPLSINKNINTVANEKLGLWLKFKGKYWFSVNIYDGDHKSQDKREAIKFRFITGSLYWQVLMI